jgi:hypothetical protein
MVSNQENSKREEERVELNYHSRLLDPLEAPKRLCVFEGSRPCITKLLDEFRDEHHFWCLVGARGLRTLGLGHGGGLG